MGSLSYDYVVNGYLLTPLANTRAVRRKKMGAPCFELCSQVPGQISAEAVEDSLRVHLFLQVGSLLWVFALFAPTSYSF